jgi:hypothetical protein
METFELWSYDVQGDLGEYAEHTYLRCPDRDAYFNCWGNHASPKQGPGVRHFACQGLYDVADEYRRPFLSAQDTAGIGVYGVNGVCHQTANLFLYSSGRVIAIQDGVKGYAITSLAYGPYGDYGPLDDASQALFFAMWKSTVYDPCYNAYIDAQGASSAQDLGATLFGWIKRLHDDIVRQGMKINPLELLHQQAALLVQQAVPGLEAALFKDLHLDFLKEKNTVLATGMKGQQLADTLNGLATQFQLALCQRIGNDAYEKLTGMNAGKTINIIDPAIAAVV